MGPGSKLRGVMTAQGGGMQPPMGPDTQAGGAATAEIEQIFQMATQMLGRPPRDIQEAAEVVFAQQPTDGMGEALEGMGARPPFLNNGRPMR